MFAGIIAGEIYGVAKAVDIVPIKISGTGPLAYNIGSYRIMCGIFNAIMESEGNGGVINLSVRTMWSGVMLYMAKMVRLFSAFFRSSVPTFQWSLTLDVDAGSGEQIAYRPRCR
jgi:hypothetical protein